MDEPIKRTPGQPSIQPSNPADSIPLLRTLRRVKRAVHRLFSLFVLLAILLAGLLLFLRVLPMPPLAFTQSTLLIDIHGNIIDSSHNGENRHIIALQDISPYMRKAALAIEDKRFYTHFGIDPIGLTRAVWVNIAALDLHQGASTLTQQLARNLFLTHEKTFTRKIKEALYALQLEMAFSKDEILAMYLNQIYFGHGAYGVEAAAKLYFAKSASRLSIAESALLASVMKSWKYYSPHMNYDRSIARQRMIIQEMAAQGMITADEATQALAESLQIVPPAQRAPAKAPYFRDYVRSVAVGRLGIDEAVYDSGGLKVYTTLDLHAQQIAEETVTKYAAPHAELQAALVAIDPRTGTIQAMVGGRDYAVNQYNRAVASKRQPGSSFKPLLYLTALQEPGFTATTRFESKPTVFTYDEGRKTYAPQNFGNKYANQTIDLRYAISKSDNVYAVHTLLQVGAPKVIETARQLGIKSDLEPLPSLGLGTFPVSPLEMASAFAIIANNGLRTEPTAILKIEDAYGRVLYRAQPQPQQVVDARYTYVLTHLLQGVFDPGGTANRVANLLKRPVAGKTGTTNTDAWMVGYTPELATAVWVGYDRGRTITTVEAHTASPVFAEFTERVLSAVPPKLFEIPDGIASVYIDPTTGMLATKECVNPRLESFVSGTEPTEYCNLHPDAPGLSSPDSNNDEQERHWWEQLRRWWNS
jgi:1A family penicillin-binding protein